ncbi:cell division protein FtsQ/DivIB [Acanthopleuribacter pedis]|uniref:FtsQ-type POTRA domain-containing protein n=1 Tax=Acanthopleuribacter pedis TaxID=442870 RepID=A0A8J7Q1L8_9BACT|nr:FtsQ-type POTRA domain-containing protein [Acanthopleuribacter pedis]MBO1318757.1 FtsQ-type POTRA domain-containing protein [Acanthopleuribacter pedis]
MGLSTLVGYGYRTLRSHPRFAIQQIEIQGAGPSAEREIRQILEPVLGHNVFSLDLGSLQRRILDYPRVKSVVVRGEVSGTLRLDVVEHEPAGLVQIENRILVVNREGDMLGSYEHFGRPLDLPVLVGLEGNEDLTVLIERGLATLAALRDTSLVFWDNVETLNLGNPENMIVTLRSEPAPIYLGRRVIAENIMNYLSIAQRVREDYPQLQYIELGYPNQVAVMPVRGEE